MKLILPSNSIVPEARLHPSLTHQFSISLSGNFNPILTFNLSTGIIPWPI